MDSKRSVSLHEIMTDYESNATAKKNIEVVRKRRYERIFNAKDPNPYSDAKMKRFQIKVIDVLFNEQICNLVHMQDIS